MKGSEYNDDRMPFQLERLVDDAIDQILACEDPKVFINWMRGNIYEYYTGPDSHQRGIFDEPYGVGHDQMILEPEMARALAVNFAQMIWNGVPLPSNNFRPDPMTMPTRNDPCYCGSGRKYKQCCAQLPKFEVISTNETWPILFDKMDKATVARAIKGNHVPLSALNMIAWDNLEANQPKKAISILEPLLEGKIRKTNDDAEYSFTLLCNAYDGLGYDKKKTKLLHHVIDTVAKSPLRSGAWQRLATIRIDNDDAEGAWAAFRQAQRDDPDAISLSVLEVQILNVQGRNEKVAERADFWVRRLRRAGLTDDEMPLSFLIDVAKDPISAFSDLGLAIADDAGLLFKQWLEEVKGRVLPDYSINNVQVDSESDVGHDTANLSSTLAAQGLDEQQIKEAISALAKQQDGRLDGDDFVPNITGSMLLTPEKLEKLEQDWHTVYTIGKPFSVNEYPMGHDDPWYIDEEIAWSTWLQDNPEAFDSLDILDDLATALMMHPQFGTAWLGETLLKPILNRAEAIIDVVIANNDGLELPWIMGENRPVLRSLSRLVGMAMTNNKKGEIFQRSQKLIELNPNDNHGFRMIVMNQLVGENRDEEAIMLADAYPEDMSVEMVYGLILALYRLGRQIEAVEVLGDSLELLGKIPRYLIAKRVKKPKLNPKGVMLGGDDQAWYYREDMRDVWLQTPGALDWLKNAEKVLL